MAEQLKTGDLVMNINNPDLDYRTVVTVNYDTGLLTLNFGGYESMPLPIAIYEKVGD